MAMMRTMMMTCKCPDGIFDWIHFRGILNNKGKPSHSTCFLPELVANYCLLLLHVSIGSLQMKWINTHTRTTSTTVDERGFWQIQKVTWLLFLWLLLLMKNEGDKKISTFTMSDCRSSRSDRQTELLARSRGCSSSLSYPVPPLESGWH